MINQHVLRTGAGSLIWIVLLSHQDIRPWVLQGGSKTAYLLVAAILCREKVSVHLIPGTRKQCSTGHSNMGYNSVQRSYRDPLAVFCVSSLQSLLLIRKLPTAFGQQSQELFLLSIQNQHIILHGNSDTVHVRDAGGQIHSGSKPFSLPAAHPTSLIRKKHANTKYNWRKWRRKQLYMRIFVQASSYAQFETLFMISCDKCSVRTHSHKDRVLLDSAK